MSYPPPGESSSDLWLERSNLVGTVLGGVAYGEYLPLFTEDGRALLMACFLCSISPDPTNTSGVHVAVFAECLYHVLHRNTNGSKRKWLLVGFIWIMFAMGTVNLARTTRMTQLMFIDNRASPGGPNAWFTANYSNGVNTAGNAAYIIANFFADSLLVSLLAYTEVKIVAHACNSCGGRTWSGTLRGLLFCLS